MLKKFCLAFLILISTYLAWQIFGTIRAKAALNNVPKAFVMEQEGADLTVVEFMDYACVHCRTIHPIIMDAIEKDGRIKYIVRPLPSTDNMGLLAARLAYAGALQEQFKNMHETLVENFDALSQNNIQDIALLGGVDADTLESDAKSTGAKTFMQKNFDVFAKLGGQFTPTFFIGKNIIFVPNSQEITADDFLKLFRQARQKK